MMDLTLLGLAAAALQEPVLQGFELALFGVLWNSSPAELLVGNSCLVAEEEEEEKR
jgi:hypothetical protein